jgi:hypothetical protein
LEAPLFRSVFFRLLSGLLGLMLIWGFVATISAGEDFVIGPVGALAVCVPFVLIAYGIGGQKLLRRIAPSLAEKKDE